MADKVMTAEARITASDRTGGVFAKLARQMGMMSSSARALSGTRFANAGAAAMGRQMRMAEKMNASMTALAPMAARYIGPAAAAYGATKAVRAYADVEMAMTRVAITANATDQQATKALQSFRTQGPAMGVTAKEMASAADIFVAAGLEWDTAIGSVPATVKAAKASGGTISDLTGAGVAAIQQFGFTANTLGEAFDLMAYGGKMGRYELNSMAKDLPSIGAGAKQLGLTGAAGLAKTVAALEIIREYTGTSDEAANRWENIAQKAFAPETIKNFKKFGIDLEKRIKEGAKRGVDGLQVLLEETMKATGGDRFKVGQLFGDAQVLQGMMALLPNLRRLADDTSKIRTNSAGTIDQDAARVAKTADAAINRMSASFDRLMGLSGELLSKVAVPVMDTASDIIESPNKPRDPNWNARANKWLNYLTTGEASPLPLDEHVKNWGPKEDERLWRAKLEREKQANSKELEKPELDEKRWAPPSMRRHVREKRSRLEAANRDIDRRLADMDRFKAEADAIAHRATVMSAANAKWDMRSQPVAPIGSPLRGDGIANVGGDFSLSRRLPAPGAWDRKPEPYIKLPATSPMPPERPASLAPSSAPILGNINDVLGGGKIEASIKPDQVKAELFGSADVKGEAQVNVVVKIDDGALVRGFAELKQGMMQLRGEIRAGKSSATSMPMYEK
ncbi:phage tail tape measure protein [Camelimonas sp. ID_303_24]